MWYDRDFSDFIGEIRALPIKVLKGPRQAGKTSLLQRLVGYQTVYFDDAAVRSRAQEDPTFFLDNSPPKLILDECPLAPAVFPELKRRVDQQRRDHERSDQIDYWITGSNQTLLQRNVRETLAGRASYFDLSTLSIHELGSDWRLNQYLIKGGWPELYVSPELSPSRYLDDLISTFIENDIVNAAGIEKKAAFTKFLQLAAGRVGQLCNYSDIAKSAGVDLTTVQSWAAILEENGIIRRLTPYWSNVNKRLTKTPKLYFDDVGLATRLQGWTEIQPLMVSPALGGLVESIAIGEVVRTFLNRGKVPNIHFLRSKEKVEIDLLIHLPNQRTIAAEIKTTPTTGFSEEQLKLLTSSELPVIEKWILAPNPSPDFKNGRVISFNQIYRELSALF